MKLLIVDDSNIIRRKIRRSNKVGDLEVVGSACNGLEAVELVKQTQPDLVTMDLTMPEMDGIESIEKILEVKPDTRILVVSALADKATAIRALTIGARGFICKPFTEDELNDAFEQLLEDI
ncbi:MULTISPECIES: response regulator [Motilimonas]|uniref:Response regulator n=1 Tax=Motilimonas cestriensis TaxID=2742685 RepID=A0ABS8WFG7_9GAMM|nr:MULTISPECIES: response regulator [Motilimonas]MCE0558218.1 response regulator [Motilimonas sp. E26]MCE2596299.1 response regulator [Motilimonas cestriensis]MDO6526398.1 response regulator [Motilimonas sp. 1_MG-2023]